MIRKRPARLMMIVFSVVVAALLLLPRAGKTPSPNSSADVLRFHVGSEPPTLDWNLATDNVSHRLLTNLMEGLTEYDDDSQPIPAVAQRWDVSADGKTITFILRDDVYWSDGIKVTAYDFEYSWKRLLNPATAAEYAYFLYDVVNAAEYNRGQLKDPDRVGIRAMDPTHLEIRLKRPVVYFPSLTTFMVTFPLRRDIVEKYGDHWAEPGKMVTNGPFTLEEWWHNYRLTLKANPYYQGRESPKIEEVKVYVVEEPNTALTLYEVGALDLYLSPDFPPLAAPHFVGNPEYVRLPQLRGYYYGFNVEKKPFDDVRARKAFGLAIDRSQFPAILKKGETPTSSWIPQGMFGYNPAIGLKYHPEEARRLLAEAGYPGGEGFPAITAVYNTSPENRLIAENLQAQWEKNLAIEVELDNQEWKVFLKNLKTDPPPLFRLGWGADYPDPDNFLNLFTSYSGNNNTRWKNKEFDELISQGVTTQDPQERRKIYDRAQIILCEEEVPMIPLFNQTQNYLIKKYVKGLRLNPLDYVYLKKVWLER